MGGLGLLEREGAEEGLQHLLHWQGCGTMFISVRAGRCVQKVGDVGVACDFFMRHFFIALPGSEIGASMIQSGLIKHLTGYV